MTLSELYVNIEDNRWQQAGLAALADQACAAVLAYFDLPPDSFEISLLGCDDARITSLNADFRAKPKATNVLSWPSTDYSHAPGKPPRLPEWDPNGMPTELGDIAISFDTCAREAAEQGKGFQAHVTHLLVHSTLHLLGFDHINDKDAALMEGLEVEILGNLGISNPY